LQQGYHVAGIVRRSSHRSLGRIRAIAARLELHEGDLLDPISLVRILQQTQPHEIYNLAAQSFVPTSWSQPLLTAEFNAVAVSRLLEAVRLAAPQARVYQASSSEMFGRAREVPQNETTPLNPRSPYGAAKAFGHHLTVSYREGYGLFACSGIAFNHESPRRGCEFVTRKITNGVAQIALGKAQELRLGNLDARRDWGWAPDYVRAMWLMLQQETAEDYVLATGVTHRVRDVAELAFAHVGLDWRKHIVEDASLRRHGEVDELIGDAGKARTRLGWTPTVDFPEMIRRMVDADLQRIRPDAHSHS